MADSDGPTYWYKTTAIPNYSSFVDTMAPLFGYSTTGAEVAAGGFIYRAYYSPWFIEGAQVLLAYVAAFQANISRLQADAIAAAMPQSSTLNPGAEMATLIIPNAFQVTLEATSGGQVVDNVIGVTNAGGTAAGAAAAVKAAWEAASGPFHIMSSLIVMNNYHAVDLSSPFGSIANVASTQVGGVSAANSLATVGACALVTWNGSTRSRSTRGRLYFGPIMEAMINADGRTLVGSTQTSITTQFTNFISLLAASGYPLAVLSRKLSTAFPVSSVAVESVIATQRRRIRS